MADPLGKIRELGAWDALLRAFSTGSTEAILGQEAEGQTSLVRSEMLPTDMCGDAREALKVAGVKFLGVIESDPLFQYVKLPPGWKKVATGHSMWTDLVDEKSRVRATIFYKAAFYDRSAFINSSRRYSIGIDYEREDAGIAFVRDGLETIHTTDPVSLEGCRDSYEAHDKAVKQAEAWLNTNFPEWEETTAYWD